MPKRAVRTRPFVPPEAPKTKKSESTRTRVVSVAADLFVDAGYSAVSMRDIAEKTGLTHGGLYGHFRSKGQLLVEVIRWKIAEREQSPEFLAIVNDPSRSVTLLVDDSGRDIRLLLVDAAAAARHDLDVAAGMLELSAQRHQAICDLVSADVADPDTTASIIAIVETGIAVAEATCVHQPLEQLLPALLIMLSSLATDS